MRTHRVLPVGVYLLGLCLSAQVFVASGCDSSTGKPGEVVKVDEAAQADREKKLEATYKQMYGNTGKKGSAAKK